MVKKMTQALHTYPCRALWKAHKDSDLDLYVVLKDDAAMRDIDAGLKIRLAIGDKQNMPLDIIVSKQSKYQKERLIPGIERVISKKV
jgi:hypothetical protein